ncbi:MAG: alanine racemase, partial [Bacteroidales bacterium]|nr:alanine racemase [Bacteroidales bacterium]
ELYQTVSDLLIKKNIDKFIGIGPSLKRNSSLFFKKSTFFESTGEFLNNYSKNNFNNEDILIKGSRDFKFENISAFLEYKGHRTILEINLNALVHNLNFFKSQLKSTTKIMVMVKAFSYGSGLYEIANLLQYNRVNYLGVAFIDEGILLRKSGIKTPIMVMHPEERGYENLIEYHLEPEIFNCEILEKFHTVLENKNINNYPVHIKIDTGMHRLGFNTEEIEKLIRKIKQCSRIKIKSVFSHLAASDEVVHDNFTKEQILRFEKVKTYFSKEFSYSIIYHILNSEGILRFTSAQFDMVRIGIGLYGISYSQQHNLVNVSTLKSRILQIKLVKKGETIGYGRRGLAEKNMKIGIVPIGYADGLSRNLSNGVGSFYINGKYSPIIGNICMDVCMIDITGIEVNTGDEVIIFGEENPIIKIAQKINTIPYEILTSISGRVKRIYYHE